MMKRIGLTTPENIEVEYKLADLGSRTGAVVIDLLIQGLILAGLGFAVLLVNQFQPQFWETNFGWIVGGSLAVAAGLIYGYFIVMELKMNGRTPGKKLLNLRTIRKNGQPITLKHSAIRNLFRVFIDMSGLGPLFIFFAGNHQRIGDLAASTIVVVEENKSRPVTLAAEAKLTDRIKDRITDEEYELLSDYCCRKDNLQNSFAGSSLKRYFEKKYDDLDFSFLF